MRRALCAPTAAGVLVLLLTACSSPSTGLDGADVTSAPTSISSTAPAPSDSAGASTTAAPAASAGTPAPAGSTQPTRGSSRPPSTTPVAACAPERTETTLYTQDSSAGHVNYRIAFTNRGATPCTLTGPPSVAFRGPDGSQAGPDAEPTARTGPVVRVVPGETAYSTISVVNVGTDGGPLGSRCAPVQGVGFFVDLPTTFGLKQVAADVRGCTDIDTSFMTVTPVVAGGR